MNQRRVEGTPCRLRLAPTPSGFLHLGNGVNFLLAQRWARELGASLLLRIDDLDAERVRPAYVADVFETLAWLGIEYSRGPRSPGEVKGEWSQFARMPLYESALAALGRGSVYACTCSRREVRSARARLGTQRYPGTCRELGVPLATPRASWRLRSPDPATEDFIVRRRNGRPSYQLASLVDDVHFGITHVVRGEDLRESTAMQLVLAEALHEVLPERGFDRFRENSFWHHPLLLGPNEAKLSKSAGADSLRAARERGVGAELVFAEAERLWAARPPSVKRG